MSVTLSISPQEMKEGFFKLNTARDVAALLEIKYSSLTYHLYRCTTEQKYVTFQIPKRAGGTRTIKAPISSIKIIQRKLNEILQQIYRHKQPVHGFINGHSIITNARKHVIKRWVLNVDLKNFFPTISFQRIRGMFLNKPYSLNEAAATVLAQICCSDGALPQGAPTSPIISNMICAKLDGELDRLAQKYQCEYTRYSDDITFSTNETSFPDAVATSDGNGGITPGQELSRIIADNWFLVNLNKVKLRKYDSRQEVTGLTVNKKVNVRRRFTKQIRAMLHSWEKCGLQQATNEYIARHHTQKHRNPGKAVPELKHVLYGKLCFMKQIVGEDSSVYLRYHTQFQRLVLLEQYNAQKANGNHTERGLILEKLIAKLFKISNIEVISSFTRNRNGEQIDGAFKFDGRYFLIECKWHSEVSSHRELDSLSMEASRSASGTMGLFISINGWSDNALYVMRQNLHKNVILFHGSDIEYVLTDRISLNQLIQAKIQSFSTLAEPYFSAKNLLPTD